MGDGVEVGLVASIPRKIYMRIYKRDLIKELDFKIFQCLSREIDFDLEAFCVEHEIKLSEADRVSCVLAPLDWDISQASKG